MLFLGLILSGHVFAFEIISHKGAHNKDCLNSQLSCPTSCLEWNHSAFIENTIPAIREAFKLGAERVEIDLQLSQDGEVVVIHDEHLLCKTGVDKRVDQLSVLELKKLDIAKELKFTNLKNNPLKGKGLGLLPTLPEVLKAFPGKGFLLNPKTDDPVFQKRLNEVLREFTQQRKTHSIENFSMWGPTEVWKSLRKSFPNFGKRFSSSGNGLACEFSYQAYGWAGYFPDQCRGFILALPAWRLQSWDLWGGPLGMLNFFHQHESQVYILHLDDETQFRRYYTLQFDGVIASDLRMVP